MHRLDSEKSTKLIQNAWEYAYKKLNINWDIILGDENPPGGPLVGSPEAGWPETDKLELCPQFFKDSFNATLCDNNLSFEFESKEDMVEFVLKFS